MFWTRLASGAVLIVIALLTIITGGPVLDVTLLLISCIGYGELVRAFGLRRQEAGNLLLEGAGYVGTVALYGVILLCRVMGYPLFFSEMLVLMLVFFTEMFLYVFSFPKLTSSQITEAFFSFVYAPVMLSFIDLTRNLPDGKYAVWLIIISAWGCDTCAYCAGVLLGKHKMSPILSPKKTVEGAIGGILGAAILGGCYAAVVADQMSSVRHPVIFFALISALGAVISMVGDLAASAIKRDHEIKDYGKLIPGHGGIMDRFDSVIFTAPVTYFLSVFLLQIK
jgi:phosphatidate cytidylyltransferase